MADIIQIRRDTAANWTSTNPTLAQGEIGWERDTGRLKIGDGSTAWNSLDAMNVLAETLTNKTIDGDVNTLQDIATSSLKTRSGSDATVITGTKGTNGYVAKWNADGDLVDGVVLPSGALTGLSDTQTLTNKRITKRVVSTTSTATLTINSDSYDIAILTAQAAALTIASPSGTPTEGQQIIIRIKDNGTARAISWNAVFVVEGVTLPTTTVVSKWHRIGCMWCSTTSKWKVIAVAVEA